MADQRVERRVDVQEVFQRSSPVHRGFGLDRVADSDISIRQDQVTLRAVQPLQSYASALGPSSRRGPFLYDRLDVIDLGLARHAPCQSGSRRSVRRGLVDPAAHVLQRCKAEFPVLLLLDRIENGNRAHRAVILAGGIVFPTGIPEMLQYVSALSRDPVVTALFGPYEEGNDLSLYLDSPLSIDPASHCACNQPVQRRS